MVAMCDMHAGGRIKLTVAVPFWAEADFRFGKINLPPTSVAYDSLQLLRSATNDFLHAYQLAVKGLMRHDVQIVEDSMQELQRINDRVNEKAKAVSTKRDLTWSGWREGLRCFTMRECNVGRVSQRLGTKHDVEAPIISFFENTRMFPCSHKIGGWL